MYENYWQLLAKPFEGSGDPRFYYPSEVHQGALLKLRYAIESRRGGRRQPPLSDPPRQALQL